MTKKKYQEGMGNTARLHITMTDAEKFALEQAAYRVKLTVSEFVRVAITDKIRRSK